MGDAQLIIDAFVEGLTAGRGLPLLSAKGVQESQVEMDQEKSWLQLGAL